MREWRSEGGGLLLDHFLLQLVRQVFSLLQLLPLLSRDLLHGERHSNRRWSQNQTDIYHQLKIKGAKMPLELFDIVVLYHYHLKHTAHRISSAITILYIRMTQ